MENSEPVSSPADAPGTSKWQKVKLYIVLLLALGAIYVSAGSLFFGEWWYGLIWRANFLSWPYIRNAIAYLADEYFWATIVALLFSLFFGLMLARYWSRTIWRFIQQNSTAIVFSAIITLSVTALLDRHFFSGNYDEAWYMEDPRIREARQALDEYALHHVDPHSLDPTLRGPIEFKFLDDKQIESLYSQITPELIEKGRSVENSGKTSTKLGIEAGSVKGGFENEQGSQVKSNLERVEFSLERKAIETINYSLETATAHYYSTLGFWLAKKEITDEPLRAMYRDVLARKGDFTSAEYRALAVPSSEEYKAAEIKRRKDDVDLLLSQLSQNRGLVLIDGSYSIQNNGRELTLTYSFMEKPKPARFEVKVPTLTHLDNLGQKSFFRIFAAVDEPLNKKGIVRLHALAVY